MTGGARETLDIDSGRPPFLLLGLPAPCEAGQQDTALDGGLSPKSLQKPNMGLMDSSDLLSRVQTFLASAGDATAGVVVAEPEIIPVAEPEVRVRAESSDDSDQESDSSSSEREVAQSTGHVEINIGVGLFDVEGSVDALVSRGIPEAAGCRPEEDVPLVQEIASTDTAVPCVTEDSGGKLASSETHT
mmetsp:Transcript_20406/g.54635  ORF Transcript_20406/g.54635 Transcript_20406/m.54635 type:complete len:188 (-) Transcript_20406:241-804(-)|eukprot:CAMPEP_0194538260 /NCGR_PEP_ID=MMETSP0253-20130528/77729_1 /TAXON_ID=2966 /ORGANISM="Noctiluca scintillans" /LENGTH=187 /DNA_ID=CAMNT_0039384349 /DNA_START=52 /DNA_END=615 /DNA_ORIENTATION=+